MNFTRKIEKMIKENVSTIYINWVNLSESQIKKNPSIVLETRKKLFISGYKRTVDYNAPQETYIKNGGVK